MKMNVVFPHGGWSDWDSNLTCVRLH